jgi:hypothetical protein
MKVIDSKAADGLLVAKAALAGHGRANRRADAHRRSG